MKESPYALERDLGMQYYATSTRASGERSARYRKILLSMRSRSREKAKRPART